MEPLYRVDKETGALIFKAQPKTAQLLILEELRKINEKLDILIGGKANGGLS